MFPRARRRRWHSLGYHVYMGTHPVAVLIALYVNALIICCVLGWLMLVGSASDAAPVSPPRIRDGGRSAGAGQLAQSAAAFIAAMSAVAPPCE
jgi:hypothetical protein